MRFLQDILHRLAEAGDSPVVEEVREGQVRKFSGKELLQMFTRAVAFIERGLRLQPPSRCAILGPNSARWIALDLALMAKGIIVVPLYARQAPCELAAMVRDSEASAILCDGPELGSALLGELREAPATTLFDEIFKAEATTSISMPAAVDAPVTIIYTSGTSGEAKGVVLTGGNVDFMLGCTAARLDKLMGKQASPERVFHYLPFNFAASWIALLSYLSRHSVVTLSTDLGKLADEMRIAAPNYFLNVPALLERVRAKVEDGIRAKGGWIAALYVKAKRAYLAGSEASFGDRVALEAARRFLFPTVRKTLGPQLKALICGSAPLAVETQKFFFMLGIPVLQAYGLTETTAICTLDDPSFVEPGCVGPAIPGIEMKLGENQEILVRGPNIFSGYWNRPDETARALRDGWFHTGDQGEVNRNGRWKITGRIKNLIVLNSGHNVAPEPLEEELANLLPGTQVMMAGNGHSYLAALIASGRSTVNREQANTAIEALNARLPHYRQIRAFHLTNEPFTIEGGMLTANGKLRRDAIAAHFRSQIEELYRKRAQ
ncbi:MAG TPA: AMP-binding protein [Candidatus Acidoferrales bacterium]|nr:AMP-binding protein [Candidatus Acidoferrales bacterium]